MPAGSPARQQHVRQVDARNQQQQAHHRHHRHQRPRELIAQGRGQTRGRRLHAKLQLAHHGGHCWPWFFLPASTGIAPPFPTRARAIDMPGRNRPINCTGPGRIGSSASDIQTSGRSPHLQSEELARSHSHNRHRQIFHYDAPGPEWRDPRLNLFFQ
jgi:hypothetical protein